VHAFAAREDRGPPFDLEANGAADDRDAAEPSRCSSLRQHDVGASVGADDVPPFGEPHLADQSEPAALAGETREARLPIGVHLFFVLFSGDRPADHAFFSGATSPGARLAADGCSK
jgi:hypothetical protein